MRAPHEQQVTKLDIEDFAETLDFDKLGEELHCIRSGRCVGEALVNGVVA